MPQKKAFVMRNRRRRGELNDKRRMVESGHDLGNLAQPDELTYGGNPEHKRNPGDFNLTPPAAPNPDKTLCDGTGIFEKGQAVALLREGMRRGLISVQREGRFPKKIWAVTESGCAVEGRLDNAEQGNYHGYPLDVNDRFREKVLERWLQ